MLVLNIEHILRQPIPKTPNMLNTLTFVKVPIVPCNKYREENFDESNASWCTAVSFECPNSKRKKMDAMSREANKSACARRSLVRSKSSGLNHEASFMRVFPARIPLGLYSRSRIGICCYCNIHVRWESRTLQPTGCRLFISSLSSFLSTVRTFRLHWFLIWRSFLVVPE